MIWGLNFFMWMIFLVFFFILLVNKVLKNLLFVERMFWCEGNDVFCILSVILYSVFFFLKLFNDVIILVYKFVFSEFMIGFGVFYGIFFFWCIVLWLNIWLIFVFVGYLFYVSVNICFSLVGILILYYRILIFYESYIVLLNIYSWLVLEEMYMNIKFLFIVIGKFKKEFF